MKIFKQNDLAQGGLYLIRCKSHPEFYLFYKEPGTYSLQKRHSSGAAVYDLQGANKTIRMLSEIGILFFPEGPIKMSQLSFFGAQIKGALCKEFEIVPTVDVVIAG